MLRPYVPDDLDTVLHIWDRASRIAHWFLPAEFFEQERDEIAETWLPVAETTVYESDGSVVGFISMIGNGVGAIFVDPDHQGHGAGRTLIAHAERSRPFLDVEVFEQNAIGRRFYDAYGFRFESRHIDEKTGQVVLRLRLG